MDTPPFRPPPEIPAELFTFAMEMRKEADVRCGASAGLIAAEKRGARTYQGVLMTATQHRWIERLVRLWAMYGKPQVRR